MILNAEERFKTVAAATSVAFSLEDFEWLRLSRLTALEHEHERLLIFDPHRSQHWLWSHEFQPIVAHSPNAVLARSPALDVALFSMFGRHADWLAGVLSNLETLGTEVDRQRARELVVAASYRTRSSPEIYLAPEGGIVVEHKLASAFVSVVLEGDLGLLSAFSRGGDVRVAINLTEASLSELKKRYLFELDQLTGQGILAWGVLDDPMGAK